MPRARELRLRLRPAATCRRRCRCRPPDLSRIHVRIAAQDVLPHAVDGDDSRRCLIGRLQPHATMHKLRRQLFRFPRPQQLRGCGRSSTWGIPCGSARWPAMLAYPRYGNRPGPLRRCPARCANPPEGLDSGIGHPGHPVWNTTLAVPVEVRITGRAKGPHLQIPRASPERS